MQMLMQTLPTSKLSGQQASGESLELPEGEGKEGFLQLLGKAMTNEGSDGESKNAEGGNASVDELLAEFFSEGDQLIAEFGDQLKDLFEGSFDWSDEMKSIIENLPKEMQAMTDMLTGLDNEEMMEVVKESLSANSSTEKDGGLMVAIEQLLVNQMPSSVDKKGIEPLMESVKEFLSQSSEEMTDKIKAMNTEEKTFASSLTGLLAIINQAAQQSSNDSGSSGLTKQTSPEFSNSIASLVNSFTAANQKQPDTANPQKIMDQLSRWLENQSGQQNQTKSMETLVQQLKKDTSSETAAKNNYLQQLLNKGLSSSETASSKAQPPSLSTQDSTGVMAKAQQAVLHLGEGKTEQARSQEFMKQFQDLIGKSNLQSFKNGTQQLTLKLHPEHLGRLDVKLTQQNGQMTAQLLTTTKTARDMVESQIQQLRATFQQQNIQVDRIDIQQQQPSHLQQGNQGKEQQEHASEQQADSQESPVEDDNESFADMLEDLTFNEQV
ncbi:flagellar hook-length control protein FliK [Salibacterium salarium]|nr:flagellar hook-length control protein FliK [Salibacterium salarium]